MNYCDGMKCFEAMEAMGVFEAFCKGSVIKYMWRLGRSETDPLVDLRKAKLYVEKLIEIGEGSEGLRHDSPIKMREVRDGGLGRFPSEREGLLHELFG